MFQFVDEETEARKSERTRCKLDATAPVESTGNGLPII